MKFLYMTTIVIISINVFSQSFQDVPEKQNNLKNLEWLSGYWTAEIDGTKMEELWLPESNGNMIGIHRDSFKSGKVFFEYLKIVETDNLFAYYASPMGKNTTEFKLISLNEQKVVFENLENDFPQKIIYSLSEDTLFVRIEGYVDGNLKFKDWQWFKTQFEL
jgi:uncharacterized protein DUF6265